MTIKDLQEEKRICEDIIRALDKPRRLIDADKLKADFIGKRYGTQAIEYVIDEQPTVDAEPVRHGHWINHFDDLFPEESTQECSICHAEQMGTMLNDTYCPNCGAKMDEVTIS